MLQINRFSPVFPVFVKYLAPFGIDPERIDFGDADKRCAQASDIPLNLLKKQAVPRWLNTVEEIPGISAMVKDSAQMAITPEKLPAIKCLK